MYFAAVPLPKIDVVPDGFDWANLFIGLGGFAAAIVAIYLARRAQHSADTSVAAERRRVFELEILRDLMKDLDESNLASNVVANPSELRRYKLRLGLLSAPLPFWNQILALEKTQEVLQLLGLDDEYREAQERGSRATDEHRAATAEYEKLDEALRRQTYELSQAEGMIKQRDLLAKRRNSLVGEQNQADQDAFRQQLAGAPLLTRKLAYDVEQQILSHVEAGRRPRPTWWNNYRVR